jgi:hypothetical protein
VFPRFAVGVTFVVILMDYAALDDITTGNETSFLFEYLFLMGSAVWFAALIKAFYRNRKRA